MITLLMIMTLASFGIAPYGPYFEVPTPQFPTIQSCIDSVQAWSPAEDTIFITLAPGVYEENVKLRASLNTSIIGPGAGQATIKSNDPDYPWVIYAPYFNWKEGEKDIPTPLGGWVIQISGVTIWNGPGKSAEPFMNTAVYTEWSNIWLDDCVIVSESNAALATDMCYSVHAHHCVFIAPAYERRIVVLGNEFGCKFTDSIFLGGPTVKTAIQASNGGDETRDFVTVQNCCFWQVNQAFESLRQPERQIPLNGSILADPRLGSNFRLFPDSPCLGAGTPEIDPDTGEETPTDIGLRPDPEASPPVYGDANGDGEVDALDIQLVINKVLGRPNTPLEYFCDANGDGAVGAVDIQRTIMAVLGKM